jgi:hypothetical protein
MSITKAFDVKNSSSDMSGPASRHRFAQLGGDRCTTAQILF